MQFNQLFTMTNMPIKRFADQLHRQGRLAEYMQLLVDSFNPATLDSLMCRSLVSVSHDGLLYDCDFNQALAMPLRAPGGSASAGRAVPGGDEGGLGEGGVGEGGVSVWHIESLDELSGWPIATANHCFGCTAGMGSS